MIVGVRRWSVTGIGMVAWEESSTLELVWVGADLRLPSFLARRSPTVASREGRLEVQTVRVPGDEWLVGAST